MRCSKWSSYGDNGSDDEYGDATTTTTSSTRRRRRRYPAVASAGLQAVQPFSLETYGRLGDGMLQVLHAAWQRLQECRDDARGWTGIWQFQRWLALLNCDLQRSLFEAEQAVAGDLRLAQLEAPLAALVLPFQR